MYRVIKNFTDLQDDKHDYRAGAVYPRNGYSASPDRIKELSTSANLQGVALIEEVREAGEAAEIVDKPDSVENEPRKRARKQKQETE